MLRIAQGVTMSKYISRDFRSEGARMGTHTLSEAIGKRGMQTRQCPLWFFFLEGEIFFFEVCVSSSDLQLAMKAQKALNFWSFCFHPPPQVQGLQACDDILRLRIARDWTQGCRHARQEFHQLSYMFRSPTMFFNYPCHRPGQSVLKY